MTDLHRPVQIVAKSPSEAPFMYPLIAAGAAVQASTELRHVATEINEVKGRLDYPPEGSPH